MRVARDHMMTAEAARRRIEGQLPTLLGEFGGSVAHLEYSWRGDALSFAFTVRGFAVTGSVLVDEVSVALDARLPLMLRPFEGSVRLEVEKRLREIFPD